ncbi:cytochrome P450 1A1-like [Haliotis cracherodii]|uniref:cytochrome P450 1A1-like n=1 Tax=Haliotis cracherodii TaxID=6455 RepID=UPI0039E7FA72
MDEITTKATFYIIPTLLAALLVYFLRKKRNRLPGPFGLPILGHLPFLGDNPHLTFTKWRRQYGDVYQIQMGSWPSIVVCGMDLIKQALTQADDVSGRPGFFSGKSITGGKNLTFGRFDSSWIKHRKIASGVLYTFANARKNPVEEIIKQEVCNVAEIFKSKGDNCFDPKEALLFASASVIYQICYGKTDQIEYDEDFKSLITSSTDFNDFTNAGNPVDMMPWLRVFFPSKVNKFLDIVERAERVRRQKVAEHKTTFDPNNLRDVTDGLLAAAQSIPEVEMAELGLTHEQILSSLDNFFGAGFDTIANTLHWSVLLLASFPDVQEKLYQEICDVTGSTRSPCLSDKSKMPYTEATCSEIMRFSCIFPLALPHFTTKDTRIGSYDIPESTLVFFNFHSLTHDKGLWGDPESFKPGRFLDRDGQIDKGVLNRLIPFSAGRRRCVAEFLARMEFFLLLTGIVQTCQFKLPTEGVRDLEPLFELSLRPKPFQIVVKERDQGL